MTVEMYCSPGLHVWGTDWWLGDGEKLGILKIGSRIRRNNVLDYDEDLDSILGLSLQ